MTGKVRLLICLMLFPMVGNAVVFYSTGDTSYNTTAPTGTLTNSGWQFQGQFNSYLGTPIAPHHFITAAHIGGSVGNTFHYDGQTYTTIGKKFDSGNSDFMLWEIDGTFASYAPIYPGGSEVGKSLVVFGRGVDRGAAVTNTYAGQAITNGWKWGAYNYTQRWGSNVVSGTTTVNGYPMIKTLWDAGAGDDECMLTDKDSGGAVFINDGGTWKLAGINYAIGPGWTYSLYADGSNSFNGAIIDFHGGVYLKDGTNWVLQPGNQKSSFYSTRISSRYAWITNNIPDFDRDVDGLPDWWETAYGGDATSMTAGGHSDSDGYTNFQEWLADTDPTNGASFFEITEWSGTTNVTFISSTNRKYRLVYREELITDLWQPEGDWITGGNGETVRTILGSASNRFYRAEVKVR